MPVAYVNGINIYYQVHGEGEPLLLIQGFGSGHEGWFFQTRAFKKHYQTIIFDNRGIGRTDRSSVPFTIETMAEDTVGLMDHLGISCAHILGMSLGGIVAQEIAISYPERLVKLVLACTSYGEGGSKDDVHPELLRALGVGEGSNGLNLGDVDFHRSVETVVSLSFNRKLYRMILTPLSVSHLQSVGVEGHIAQMEAVAGHSTLDRLHMIMAPTLVVAGTGDRMISPRFSEVIAGRIPGARFLKLDGGSHALNIEMRSEFNQAVLSFLGDSRRETSDVAAIQVEDLDEEKA
jgi:3-oxoadipate enol-lactonase